MKTSKQSSIACSKPLFKLNNISFSYSKFPVLKNIYLNIQEKEFTAIIGPNGSGKSTLLKLFGGILSTGPNKIYFKGQDITKIKRKSLATSISWIPQDHSMPFSFKVMEIVMMGRHPYLPPLAFESDHDNQIAQNALKLTDTLQFHNKSFNQISGGEKQRVLLASAIAQEPEIMLLDEPTSALDLKYQIQILNILKLLNETKNTSLILAMHDLHLASKFCKRLILLKNGEIFADGTPQNVLKKEILEKVYEVEIDLITNLEDGSILVSPKSS